MIEWIEQNLDQSKILEQLSKESGYPPWYCSVRMLWRQLRNWLGILIRLPWAMNGMSKRVRIINDTIPKSLAIKFLDL